MTPEQRRAQEFVRKQLDLWLPRPKPAPARRRCSFDLPVNLADRFRSACALQGHNMREIAQHLFQAYVDQHEESHSKRAVA